jgi:hypothetical protein
VSSVMRRERRMNDFGDRRRSGSHRYVTTL